MRHHFRLILLTAFMLVVVNASHAMSNQVSDPPKMFGIGEPASIDELPPGPTRERLVSLPAPARERALEWLQRFEFPAADLDAMQIDDQGGVLYVEPLLPSSVSDGSQN